MPPQRVEIMIGVRTLLTLLAFGLLVVLAILSLDALLSIFLAAVIALGLDPVVAALIRRGRAEAASTLLGAAGAVFGPLLSLVTLTFLALFLLIVAVLVASGRL